MYKHGQPSKLVVRLGRWLLIAPVVALLAACIWSFEADEVSLRAQEAPEQPPDVTEVFILQHANASNMQEVLQSILDDVRVAVDRNRNALILRGKAEALTQSVELLKKLDVPSQSSDPSARVEAPNEYRYELVPPRAQAGVIASVPAETLEPAPAGQPGFYGYHAHSMPTNGPGIRWSLAAPKGADRGEWTASAGSSPENQALVGEIAQLEQQTIDKVQHYRSRQDSLESAEREKLSAEIRQLVEQTFDKRHQLQQLEVEHLQRRLEKVQNSLARRQELRGKIIDKHLDELLAGDELLWNPNATPGYRFFYHAPNTLQFTPSPNFKQSSESNFKPNGGAKPEPAARPLNR